MKKQHSFIYFFFPFPITIVSLFFFFFFYFLLFAMVQTLPLFGSPLVTALARSSVRTSSGLCIPGILARCFSEIQRNGMRMLSKFKKETIVHLFI